MKSFSFFVRDEFIEFDKSRKSRKHPEMTENEVLLLREHLKRRRYCFNEERKLNFIITKKQNPVYQEVCTEDTDVKLVNITPIGFFGECINN
ncbi:hypothetical protein ACFL0U_00600 [Pseudomonadota bacterium]